MSRHSLNSDQFAEALVVHELTKHAYVAGGLPSAVAAFQMKLAARMPSSQVEALMESMLRRRAATAGMPHPSVVDLPGSRIIQGRGPSVPLGPGHPAYSGPKVDIPAGAGVPKPSSGSTLEGQQAAWEREFGEFNKRPIEARDPTAAALGMGEAEVGAGTRNRRYAEPTRASGEAASSGPPVIEPGEMGAALGPDAMRFREQVIRAQPRAPRDRMTGTDVPLPGETGGEVPARMARRRPVEWIGGTTGTPPRSRPQPGAADQRGVTDAAGGLPNWVAPVAGAGAGFFLGQRLNR